MAIDFEPLSFAQNNPWIEGFLGGQQINQNQQQLYKNNQENKYLPAKLEDQQIYRRLVNALKQNEANYAPRMSEASLQGKTIGNAIAQNELNFAPRMSQADLNHKQAMIEALKARAMNISNNGNNSTNGGVRIDPDTGEVISMPTKANQTLLQRALFASERLPKTLDAVSNGITPYLGFGQALRPWDLLVNKTRFAYPESLARESNYGFAKSLLHGSALEQSALEQKIPPTVEALKQQEVALAPGIFESPRAYQARLAQRGKESKESQKQFQAMFKGYLKGKMPGEQDDQQGKIEASRVLNGQTYVKINGQWHEQ